MSSLTRFFEKQNEGLPPHKFQIGDRVYGHWNNIPFIGSVGNDKRTEVSISIDLPIKFEGVARTHIIVPSKDVELLKEF